MLIFTALFLAPWLTSYAYGTNDGDDYDRAVNVEAAESPMTPTATFFGRTIGGVKPGDLFYIDATSSPHDMTAGLYITNANELVPCLRYLILEVGIYVEGEDGQWGKALSRDGSSLPNTFITLRNSPVNFVLSGHAKYKITIDSGSYNCLTANTNGDNISPKFYLALKPA